VPFQLIWFEFFDQMATVKLSLACPGVLALVQPSTMLTSRCSLTQFSLFMSGSTLAKKQSAARLEPCNGSRVIMTSPPCGFYPASNCIIKKPVFFGSLCTR
jgi:hypothetical protein